MKKDKEGSQIRKRSASVSKARSGDEKQKEKKPRKTIKDSEAKGKAEAAREMGRISINLKAAPAQSCSAEEGNQSLLQLLPPLQPLPQASMAQIQDELHEAAEPSVPEAAVPTTLEPDATAPTPQEGLPANFKFPKGYPPPRPEKEAPPSTFPANFRFPMGYPPPKPGSAHTATTSSAATAAPAVAASPTVTGPAHTAPLKASAPSACAENSQDVNASAIAAVATAAASGSLPPGTTQVVVVPSQNPGEAPLILSLQGGDLSTLLSLLQSPPPAAVSSTSTTLPSTNNPTSMLPLLQPASSPAPRVMVSLNSGPPPSQYVQLQSMQSVVSVPQQGVQYVVAGSPNHFGGPSFQQVSVAPQRPAMVNYAPAPHGAQPGLPSFGSPLITPVGQFTTSLPVQWGRGVPTAQPMQAYSYLSPPPPTTRM